MAHTPSEPPPSPATVHGCGVEIHQHPAGFIITVPDLPSVSARGTTFSEALYRAEGAVDAFLAQSIIAPARSGDVSRCTDEPAGGTER